MKKSLLLLGVLAALAIGAPAYSQYIFMDVNNDQTCVNTGGSDLLTSSISAVDVWLDTNHSQDGTLRTCVTNPSQPVDIFSYDLVVHQSGSGSVTFNSWTNSASGFQLLNPLTVAGADAGVGYTAPLGGNLAPGLYKLGTFGVTVTGNPKLDFVGLSSNASIPSFGTGFGSSCDASDFANTMVLGTDFFDGCGTSAGTPTENTTWGKIKQLYR
jgi:hypothetical protein